MNKTSIFLMIMLIGSTLHSQSLNDSIKTQINGAQRLLNSPKDIKLTIGGYGEITYNQKESNNGELDVQRLVVLIGYKFSDQVQFISEIEYEHVQEVFVEQAFVNYNVLDNFNIRGGLMLVPIGIVNEYHEPTTFNGTERPSVDNIIVPTTWREIGLGISGRIPEINISYQAYVFNGFKSTYTNNGTDVLGYLKGSNGLRSGRQKGIQSTIDSPTFASKIEYFGIPGLRLGLSGYFGKTQAEDEIDAIQGASIGIRMIGLDARYNYRRVSLRGQLINTTLTDVVDYNTLTGRDLGSEMLGWYVEAAYNLLAQEKKQKLVAFGRYENYNTHAKTSGDLAPNQAFDRSDITLGLSYHIAPGVVFKSDYQFKNNALSGDQVKDQFNMGIGVWF